VSELINAASIQDSANTSTQNPRSSRRVNTHELVFEGNVEEDIVYDTNVHDMDTPFTEINAHDHRGNGGQPRQNRVRMNKVTWDALVKADQDAWDTMSDAGKVTILTYASNRGNRNPTVDAQVHERVFEDDDDTPNVEVSTHALSAPEDKDNLLYLATTNDAKVADGLDICAHLHNPTSIIYKKNNKTGTGGNNDILSAKNHETVSFEEIFLPRSDYTPECYVIETFVNDVDTGTDNHFGELQLESDAIANLPTVDSAPNGYMSGRFGEVPKPPAMSARIDYTLGSRTEAQDNGTQPVNVEEDMYGTLPQLECDFLNANHDNQINYGVDIQWKVNKITGLVTADLDKDDPSQLSELQLESDYISEGIIIKTVYTESKTDLPPEWNPPAVVTGEPKRDETVPDVPEPEESLNTDSNTTAVFDEHAVERAEANKWNEISNKAAEVFRTQERLDKLNGVSDLDAGWGGPENEDGTIDWNASKSQDKRTSSIIEKIEPENVNIEAMKMQENDGLSLIDAVEPEDEPVVAKNDTVSSFAQSAMDLANPHKESLRDEVNANLRTGSTEGGFTLVHSPNKKKHGNGNKNRNKNKCNQNAARTSKRAAGKSPSPDKKPQTKQDFRQAGKK
jgi:hypothetical protein